MSRRLLQKTWVILTIILLFVTSFPAPASAVVQVEPPQRLASKVRYRAKTDATVIGSLENGTPLTILGEKNGFYHIDCYDMEGYIAKEQVAVDDNEYYVNVDSESKETKELESLEPEDAQTKRSAVLELAKAQLGIRYRYGGMSRKGFDCSGFTKYVFRDNDIDLNRTATTQMQDGVIIPRESLQPGDLVFFRIRRSRRFIASHVGIYIGDGEFIHASTSRGITINSLDEPYYDKYYLCARRVILPRAERNPLGESVATAIMAKL